jgi:glutathionylspermidine synthase
MVSVPWLEQPALSAYQRRDVRRRLMFDGCKWDPQTQDVDVLSPVPLVLRRSAWRELAASAEALYAEALACEEELLGRPDLIGALGLPHALARGLAHEGASAHAPRVMRFDFHPTADGWALSEVNADVPGGYIEASAFATLAASHVQDATPTGDPAAALVEALRASVREPSRIALVHATAYADDAQVMRFLSGKLAAVGLEPVLVGPQHVRWTREGARIECNWLQAEVSAVLRFFPAEWLPHLPSCIWKPYLRRSAASQVNPLSSLLVQSKRFPLVWERLRTPVPHWRRLLPQTVDVREVSFHDESWVLKSSLGRVGDGVAVRGVTSARDWNRMRWASRLRPSGWVAQRRFDSRSLLSDDGPLHLCVGVFVVAGRVAGAYGRAARRPLIDATAMDVAVLVASKERR